PSSASSPIIPGGSMGTSTLYPPFLSRATISPLSRGAVDNNNAKVWAAFDELVGAVAVFVDLVQPVVALVDVVAAEDTEDAGRRLRWWWKRFLRIVVAAIECDVVAAVGPVNDDTVVEV